MHRGSAFLSGHPKQQQQQRSLLANKVNRSTTQHQETKYEEIVSMLDSSAISDKVLAMRRLITIMVRGSGGFGPSSMHTADSGLDQGGSHVGALKPRRRIFGQVVKNVGCPSVELRKLIYSFVIGHAHLEPDLCLLAINTVQSDLQNHPNPLLRGMAMRAITAICCCMEELRPILLLAIQKCISDSHAYVRRMASLSIIQIFKATPIVDRRRDTFLAQLGDLIKNSLNDDSVLVIGASCAAFLSVCPRRWDLVHVHFRKLCAMLVDVDEWNVGYLLELLLRYARLHFHRPHDGGILNRQSPSGTFSNGNSLDPDHELLLNSAFPLLFSQNCAVVVAAIELFLAIAPQKYMNHLIKPLIRMVRLSADCNSIVEYVLRVILLLAMQDSAVFHSYLSTFFIAGNEDHPSIWKLKLSILLELATESNVRILLNEAQEYVCHQDVRLACLAVQFVGLLTIRIPSVAGDAMYGLMQLIELGNHSDIDFACIVAIRSVLLQSNWKGDELSDIIARLSSLLSLHASSNQDTTRAHIIWLLGHHSSMVSRKNLVSILHKLLSNFIKEAPFVKLQILTMACKIYVSRLDSTESDDQMDTEADDDEDIRLLLKYTLELCRYDANIDIRDRARLYRNLLLEGTSILDKQMVNSGEASDRLQLIRAVISSSSRLSTKSQSALSDLSPDDNSKQFRYRITSLLPLPGAEQSQSTTLIGIDTPSPYNDSDYMLVIPISDWADESQIPESSVRDLVTNDSASSGRWNAWAQVNSNARGIHASRAQQQQPNQHPIPSILSSMAYRAGPSGSVESVRSAYEELDEFLNTGSGAYATSNVQPNWEFGEADHDDSNESSLYDSEYTSSSSGTNESDEYTNDEEDQEAEEEDGQLLRHDNK